MEISRRCLPCATLLSLLLLLAACGGKEQPHTRSAASQPAVLEGAALDSVCLGYWTGYPFAELTADHAAEAAEAFMEFARLASASSVGPQAVDTLMAQAAASSAALDVFAQLSEEAFHDPNAPLRDDELYRPVLQRLLLSPYVTDTQRERYRYELDLISRNRVGHRANDFTFATADGRRCRLYDVQAEHVLLFFYNPGCAMCAEVKASLMASTQLGELSALGRLTVLAVYPDEDTEAWLNDLPSLPEEWMAVRDPDHALLDENIYNLAAIPSLYLLDADKTVLAKDVTSIPLIEQILTNRL